MNILLYLNFILIFFTMILFSMNYKHLLMTLISLEFFVLSIMYLMYIIKLFEGNSEYFIILFMIMSVCESVIGFMILVNFMRMLSYDFFQNINQIN